MTAPRPDVRWLIAEARRCLAAKSERSVIQHSSLIRALADALERSEARVRELEYTVRHLRDGRDT